MWKPGLKAPIQPNPVRAQISRCPGMARYLGSAHSRGRPFPGSAAPIHLYCSTDEQEDFRPELCMNKDSFILETSAEWQLPRRWGVAQLSNVCEALGCFPSEASMGWEGKRL